MSTGTRRYSNFAVTARKMKIRKGLRHCRRIGLGALIATDCVTSTGGYPTSCSATSRWKSEYHRLIAKKKDLPSGDGPALFSPTDLRMQNLSGCVPVDDQRLVIALDRTIRQLHEARVSNSVTVFARLGGDFAIDFGLGH